LSLIITQSRPGAKLINFFGTPDHGLKQGAPKG
jgi:hypothetical protein